MTRRTRLSVGSLLTIVSGGAFLSTPAPGHATETFDCKESVRAYCEYAAATSCGGAGATCTYDTTTCYITDIQCNTSPLRPS